MNLLDVVIILALLAALVRGVEVGVVRQIFSTIGLFGGLFLGVFIQGKLIQHVSTPNGKAMLALAVIVGSIGLVLTLCEYLGSRIKHHIERSQIKAITLADRAFGSAVGGATLLLVIWLGATIFSNAPYPGLQKQIKSSAIVAQLNKSMPAAPGLVAKLGHLIDPNRFPHVFTGLEPAIDTNKPLPSIGELDEAVQKVRASTVKIEGTGCGGISNGSGFVADKNLVITNAHVIAGVDEPFVLDANGRHRADVIWFDADLDMAVLRANNLAGGPLSVNTAAAQNGTSSAVLGYPGGGEFTAGPALVIDSFKAIGRNIYNQGSITRDVYSLKATVEPGNSGGPLVDKEGAVIGLIFAESTTYDDVGYALTMDKVMDGFTKAKQNNSLVDTGSCTQ